MAGNACWGVEVGSNALKAIKLVRDGDDLKVADWVIIPHKRVLSAPETDERDSKRLAVGTLVSQHDLTKAMLAVSSSGSQAFARFAKLPPVEPKKIPDIVKFEAVQQIPFPIDDVEWDYQTFVSPDSPDVEVGIFAITRERVTEKLAKWQDVGRTPDLLTLSPLAAYNALAYDLGFSENMPGTVILDIGTTSSDLIVAEGGRLWIRTFPIGGHQFTEALVTAFNLSYIKAERLKKEAESSQAARHVLQAMRPVFGDLAQDVQRSIGYYMSLHRDAKLTRLIGLGNTWHLPGLRKFLSQQLSMEVVRLEGFSRLKVEGEKNTEFQASAVELATAYGLALQGVGFPTIDANLMPMQVTRQAMWTSKNKWFVAAASLALAAGAATFVRPLLDSAAMAGMSKPSSIDEAKTKVKKLKAEWTTIEGEDKPDPRASLAVDLLSGREVYGHLLSDVGAIMASAEAALPTPEGKAPVVRFGQWTSAYAPPGDPNAAAASGGDPAAALPGDGKPHIRMTMQATLAKAPKDGDVLVRNTFVKWLYDNAKRQGLPYYIDDKSVRMRAIKEEKIAATGETSTTELGGPGGGPGAGGRPPAGGRPGRPPRPIAGGGPREERGGPPTIIGGGGQPGRDLQPGAVAGQGDANTLAPLPAYVLPAEPGSVLTTYQIDWDVVLGPLPEAAPTEGADAQKEGGK